MDPLLREAHEQNHRVNVLLWWCLVIALVGALLLIPFSVWVRVREHQLREERHQVLLRLEAAEQKKRADRAAAWQQLVKDMERRERQKGGVQ